ncbi:MAG: Lrp/AsnC family transcriptional regulator [Alphaproteobacteria bacterium]|nr:Lrp/AsnC family transcriptional regulator [Alphaproteobacteria bacterium]
MQNSENIHQTKAKSDIHPQNEKSKLDALDAAIVRELSLDARITTAELARRIGLSAPSVADRIRRLEDVGIVIGYSAVIDPACLGYGLTLLIRARPLPGEMQNMIDAIRETPQIVNCDRVSGEDCFVARAHVRDVAEMEAVIDRIVPFGATNSSIVQSTPVPARLVEL